MITRSSISKSGAGASSVNVVVTKDTTSYTAGENINSHMPVVLVGNLLYKMNNTNPLHAFSFLGFTQTSVITGGTVPIKTDTIALSGWGLIPNKNYLAGPNGTLILTNSVINSFTKVIAFSQDANSLLIITQNTAVHKT